MCNRYGSFGLALAAVILFIIPLSAADRFQTFIFSDIHSLNVNLTTGNVKLCPGDERSLIVRLENNLTDPDRLTPELESVDGELFIKEISTEENAPGETSWQIRLPKSSDLRRIVCFSSLGNIQMENFRADYVKAHAAIGEITAQSIKSGELIVSTNSKPIKISDCCIDRLCRANSGYGNIELGLISLPENLLEVVSTYDGIIVEIPDFGNNFSMTVSKREGEGEIICPFQFDEKRAMRHNESDAYLSDCYFITKGGGDREVKLHTTTGVIEIRTKVSL